MRIRMRGWNEEDNEYEDGDEDEETARACR